MSYILLQKWFMFAIMFLFFRPLKGIREKGLFKKQILDTYLKNLTKINKVLTA